TDINMPIMNGLEMIERLKQYSIEFIILTGYEEFSYIHKALENGVYSYLLKPINDDELLKNLHKVHEKIKQNTENLKRAEVVNKNIPKWRNQLLMDLLYGRPNDINLADMLGINIDGKYIVVTVVKSGDAASEAFFDAVKTKDINGFFAVFDIYTSAFLAGETAYRYNTIPGISAGIGSIVVEKDIKNSYMQACKCLDYTLLKGKRGVMTLADIEKRLPPQKDELKKQMNEIVENVTNFNASTLNEKIDKFLEDAFYFDDMQFTKKLVLEFVFACEREAANSDINMRDILETDKPASECITDCNLLINIKEYLHYFVHRIDAHGKINLKNIYRKEIMDAINIISREYKTVTIDSVAEQLFLSSSYLMHLFKREVGKTFNEYLVDFRMEKAKKFLKMKKYKIYEISEMLGYKNTKYFASVFKKATGMTPKEFVNTEI
ncbi:MAG: AraC family transcriptional regulator, partial [Oscillospiraceae bacterium]